MYSTDFVKMPQLSTEGRNCVLQLNADGKSQKEIAEELGCSKSGIFRILRKFEIKDLNDTI